MVLIQALAVESIVPTIIFRLTGCLNSTYLANSASALFKLTTFFATLAFGTKSIALSRQMFHYTLNAASIISSSHGTRPLSGLPSLAVGLGVEM